MTKLGNKLALIIILSSLYACGYVKVDNTNVLINELSDKYKALEISKANAQNYIEKFSLWYKSFGNKELDTFVDIIIDSNFDIVKAMYNLQAAAYELGKERSALFPSLSAITEFNHKQGSNSNEMPGAPNKKDLLNLGVAASYELDIWGKNYSAYQGAKTRLLASQEDVSGIKISTVASMMNLWINLMSLRQKEALLNKKINDSTNVLKLQKSDYMFGIIDLTDILQQENLILDMKNKLKDIVCAQQEVLRSINILIGKDPLDKINIKTDKLPKINKLPSSEINIMVLSERPDVKSAFYNMLATKWDVKLATLSRLPSFNLQAQANFVGKNFIYLMHNWLVDVVFSGAMPIFKAGALYDKQQAAKCLNKASVVAYTQIVFNAINELKTAIDNDYKYTEKIVTISKQIFLLEESASQLLNKYLSGEGNYIDYLAASSAVIDLRVAFIEQQKELLLNRVMLYRVLGIPIGYRENNNDKK